MRGAKVVFFLFVSANAGLVSGCSGGGSGVAGLFFCGFNPGFQCLQGWFRGFYGSFRRMRGGFRGFACVVSGQRVMQKAVPQLR